MGQHSTITDTLDGIAGGYWHLLEDGRMQCDLCPRACKLHEGQRGLCFVRGRAGNRMVLTSYGRSSGYCIDPIEKKPLNHFLPGTPVLSFGTAGCNLACRFCQNWDISKSREMDTLADAASPVRRAPAAFAAANSTKLNSLACGRASAKRVAFGVLWPAMRPSTNAIAAFAHNKAAVASARRTGCARASDRSIDMPT